VTDMDAFALAAESLLDGGCVATAAEPLAAMPCCGGGWRHWHVHMRTGGFGTNRCIQPCAYRACTGTSAEPGNVLWHMACHIARHGVAHVRHGMSCAPRKQRVGVDRHGEGTGARALEQACWSPLARNAVTNLAWQVIMLVQCTCTYRLVIDLFLVFSIV
jgi:hypothetical protein